jgi:hypothetical protein
MSGNQPADGNKVTVDDLRGLPREEIEILVASGLVSADIADEVLSENKEQKLQRDADYQTSQAQAKKSEEAEAAKEADWLESMSPSYQKAYHELVETYRNAETRYTDIKGRADRLKDRLHEKIWSSYEAGVHLPDGRVAFYDQKHGVFVDGASLQPLLGDAEKAAADGFAKLSPEQQKANARYVDACAAYDNAERISQASDKGITSSEQNLSACSRQVSSSEEELKKLRQAATADLDELSSQMDDAEIDESNLDAAADLAKTPETKTVSFASQVDANGIGDGNGKTATVFNAVGNQVLLADDARLDKPGSRTNRSRPVSAP